MDSTVTNFPMMPDWSDEGPDNSELNVDIRRLLLGVWSRRRMVMAMTGALLLLSVLAALLVVERSWTAKVTLLKKDQQDEFQVGRYGIPFKSQQYAFNTLLDTLLLPGTLQQAMERSSVSLPAHRMASLVGLHVSRDSKAFTITFQWNDAHKAAEIANNLSDVFIERNRALRRKEVEDALRKYMDRQQAASEAVKISGLELAEFEYQHSISDLDTQIAVLIEARQDLGVEIRELQADSSAAKDEIERLSDAINTEPTMIVQSSYYVNPLQKNLATLEWELVQALSRYTAENPKVVDLTQKIDEIKRMIEAGKDSESPSNTYTSNPVREELQVKKYESRAENHKAETRSSQLLLVLEEMDQRIEFLSSQKKNHEQLEENRSASLQLERDLRQRVDSLKVLMQSHSGDFEMLEAASVPTQPDASGRKLMVVGATLFGAFLGLLIALLRELLDRRLWTSKDVSLLKKFDLIMEFPRLDPQLISSRDPVSPVARLFRQMVNDLDAELMMSGNRNLAVVSLDSGEGRSTVASNLAQVLVQKEAEVALVDLDLRQKQLPGQRCELDGVKTFEYGSHDLLSTDDHLDCLLDCSESSTQLFVPAYVDEAPKQADALKLGGRAMRQLRVCLEQENRWLLYDLPPLSEEEAALEAAVGIGSVVLVVRSGATHRERLRLLIERMERHGIKIVAVVLTDVPEQLLSMKQGQAGLTKPEQTFMGKLLAQHKSIGQFSPMKLLANR